MSESCAVLTRYRCPQCGQNVIKVGNVPQKQKFKHWCKKCQVWVQPVARRIFVPETCTVKQF